MSSLLFPEQPDLQSPTSLIHSLGARGRVIHKSLFVYYLLSWELKATEKLGKLSPLLSVGTTFGWKILARWQRGQEPKLEVGWTVGGTLPSRFLHL